MASIGPGVSKEDIARELAEWAAALWGPERAEAIREVLERTARQLSDIARNPPDPEMEPGFYQ